MNRLVGPPRGQRPAVGRKSEAYSSYASAIWIVLDRHSLVDDPPAFFACGRFPDPEGAGQGLRGQDPAVGREAEGEELSLVLTRAATEAAKESARGPVPQA